MGYPQTAATAYATLDPALMSSTRAEAMVFARVTRRMEAIFADASSSFPTKAQVLHDNRRLWLAVSTACLSDANAFPPALRAALIGLAAFVDRQTTAVLGGKGEATALIEINRRVTGGLTAGAT